MIRFEIVPRTANGSRGQSRYFCCAGGAGFDAEIARRANSLPAWMRASGGYLLSLIPTIISFHPRLITVSVISGTTSTVKMCEPAFFVAFANAAAYGDGMIIAPRAQLQDGLLDICFIRNTGKLRLLRLVPRVYVGTHLKLPEVEYFQTRRLRVQSDQPVPVELDGELVGTCPVEFTLRDRSLRVLAPR